MILCSGVVYGSNLRRNYSEWTECLPVGTHTHVHATRCACVWCTWADYLGLLVLRRDIAVPVEYTKRGRNYCLASEARADHGEGISGRYQV